MTDPLLAAVRLDYLERAFSLMADLEAANDRPALISTLARLNDLWQAWIRAEDALNRPDSEVKGVI